MKVLTNFDLNKNQIMNAVIQPLATAPESPKLGQIYYNSTDKHLYQFNGTDWKQVGVVYSSENSDTNVITGLDAEGSVTTTALKDMKVGSETLETIFTGYSNVDAELEKGNNVVSLTATDEQTDTDVLATISAEERAEGTSAIISRTFANGKVSKTLYTFDGTKWEAADGNYDVENVYFDTDLTITAAVGVQTVGSTGSKTLATTGKNMKQVLDMLFAEEKNPGTATQPKVTLTCNEAKAYEVGTSVTPTYSASLSAGKYTYGPATEIVAKTWTVTDTNGATKDVSSGSFDAFVVTDDTSYTITATAEYDDGTIPVTNLGNEYSAGQIKGGSKSATTTAITGYRSWFVYVGEDMTTTIDDAFIQGLRQHTFKTYDVANKTTTDVNGCRGKAGTSFDFSAFIPGGTKRVMIAIPASKDKTLSSVIDIDGMGLNVVENFTTTTANVKGVGNSTAVEYDIFVCENATGLSETKYTFSF